MVELTIPPALRAAMHFMRGQEAGDHWLTELPEVWQRYAQLWKLELDVVLTGGQMSCCVLCRDAEGRQQVLKIPSDPAAGVLEASALRHWQATGAVPGVTHADATTGVLLMEYIAPGAEVPSVDAVVDLLARLGNSPAVDLETFEPLRANIDERTAWATERFAIDEYAELRALLAQAVALSCELLLDAGSLVLTHGDLQTKNILTGRDGRAWAIDPMPAGGEREYDAAFWAVMQLDADPPIEQTLASMVKLDGTLDLARMTAWAQVIAILEFRPYMPDRHDRFWHFIRETWTGCPQDRYDVGFGGPVTISGLHLPRT